MHVGMVSVPRYPETVLSVPLIFVKRSDRSTLKSFPAWASVIQSKKGLVDESSMVKKMLKAD
jgi:hypothetical protein